MKNHPSDEGVKQGASEQGKEDSYILDYEAEAEAIKRYGPGDITYSRKLGLCIDLTIPEEKSKFFSKFTDSDLPVYLIGITNNRGDFNDATKEAYVQMRSQQKEVMLGQWMSPHGNTYRDVILALSGISKDLALKYKKQYGQISIVVINKDGPTKLI